ncbi:MAG: dTDP-4-dehydrorhamnose 3,5-epimerase [Kiritimatiellia bacterium]
MQITSTSLPGVLRIDSPTHRDDRGHFIELFHADWLVQLGVDVSLIRSAVSHNRVRGTVRGLHVQRAPHAIGKLVTVTHGSVLDVIVDIRAGSATRGRHLTLRLTAGQGHSVWIPPGFAHGFCTLTDETDVLYRFTGDYAPDHQAGVRWDDPTLGIDWPVDASEAVLSARDRALPMWADLEL